MVYCPMCGQVVDRLHPVPPAVITNELFRLLDDSSAVVDLVMCAECIHRLTDGELPSGLFESTDVSI